MNLFEKYRKALYRLLLLGVFIAIGLYVFDNFEKITSEPVHLKWTFILYGLLLTALGHLSAYAIWTGVAASFEIHTSWRHAGKAWFLSRLGRYLPGKVAILLLRFGAYPSHSKTRISVATLIEAYTSLCAASILLLLLALATSYTDVPSTLSVVVLLLVLVTLSHPRVMRFGLDLAARLVAIPRLDSLPRQRETLGFSAAQLVTMFLHGGALFMAFRSIGHVDPNHYLVITAVFFVAGLIGMLAVFAPSGIGVREAALIAMLAPYIEPMTLIVGVVLIRLLGISSELILSGFFVAYDRVAPTAET